MGIECLEEKRWSEAFEVFENLAEKNVSIAFQFFLISAFSNSNNNL